VPASTDAFLPPPDGISLLDTKNDLLLSYLQNIVFLIILKLRNEGAGGKLGNDAQSVGNEAVQKLVEARVYLERGVRPLEGRLRYQIDKVLRAADVADSSSQQRKESSTRQNGKVEKGTTTSPGDSDASDAEPASAGSDDTSTSYEAKSKIHDLSYRPNPSALVPRPHPTESAVSFSTKTNRNTRNNAGTYRPPRIAPTSMPEKPSNNTNPSSRRSERRSRKSHLLDEYVTTELSSAPLAEPSIGSNSTILKRGRGAPSTSEREKERARTEYEEANFSRLPRESRAERRKTRVRGEGAGAKGRDRFGGEDWTGLGEAGDRVARTLGKREGEKRGVLERRQKRRRDVGEIGVDGGMGIGEGFEKRRKVLEGRAVRKRKPGQGLKQHIL
jgi:U3 small nucleolar ribonucleoprotein protein LCP5